MAKKDANGKSAIPSDVDMILRSYDRKFLECRDLHHVWTVIGYFNESAGIARLMACRRCGTRRTQTWGRGLEAGGNRYEYPDYYLTDGVRLTGPDVRRAVLGDVRVWGNREQLDETLTARRQRRSA